MKVVFKTTYYGGFTKRTEKCTYFGLDITQVQMWYFDSCDDELHIFLQGKKKGFVLTKNSPQLGNETNFYVLLRLLKLRFEEHSTQEVAQCIRDELTPCEQQLSD